MAVSAVNASAAPAPQYPSDFLSIAAVQAGSANPPVSQLVIQGDTAMRTKLNASAARLDSSTRYMSGVVGIADGLALQAPGSGLTLTVKKGHAIISGVVELVADATIAIPDNTAMVWIWLHQDTSLSYTTTTTPPAGLNCLVGIAMTSGGNITGVSNHGAMILSGSMAVRNTDDASVPGDTPPSGVVFLNICPAGTFLWNGTQYLQLTPNGFIPTAGVFRLYASGNGTAVVNTTTETVFDTSFSVPGNSLAVGQTLDLVIRGIYSTDGTTPGSVRLKLKLGSTVVGDTGVITLNASMSNRLWEIRSAFVVTAIGAGGTIEIQSLALISNGTGTASMADMPNSAAVSVDTTASKTLSCTVIMGAANANNTFQVRTFEILKSQ